MNLNNNMYDNSSVNDNNPISNNEHVRNNPQTSMNKVESLASIVNQQKNIDTNTLPNSSNATIQGDLLNNNSNEKKSKKYYKKFLIPVLIVVVILAVILFIKNKNIDKINYEIAKIIFSEYFGDEFDENLIESAFYDSENKVYECEYVVKKHTDFYKDSVTFRTKDFVTYSLSSVTYTKSGDSYSPYNFSTNFKYISNDAKYKILKLAKEKGYHSGEIPTKEETNRVLEIVLSNDTKNIEELLKRNNYIFKGTYIDSVHLTFLYEDKNNSENYIEIKSSMSGFDYWNVYGSSNKKISEDSRHNDYFNTYVIDYYITVKTDLEKIQPLYDKYINQ